MGRESAAPERKPRAQNKASKPDAAGPKRPRDDLDREVFGVRTPIELSREAMTISADPNTRKSGSLTIWAKQACRLRLRVTGDGFSIASPSPTSGIALEEGDKYVATIVFAPHSPGDVAGTLDITTTAASGPTLTLDTTSRVALKGTTDRISKAPETEHTPYDVKGDPPPKPKWRPKPPKPNAKNTEAAHPGRQDQSRDGYSPPDASRVSAFNYTIVSTQARAPDGTTSPFDGAVNVGERIQLALLPVGSSGPLSLTGQAAKGLSIVSQSESMMGAVRLTLAADNPGSYDIRFSRGRSQYKGTPLRVVVKERQEAEVLMPRTVGELGEHIVNELTAVLLHLSGALESFADAARSPSKNEAKHRPALEVAVSEVRDLVFKLAAQPLRKIPFAGAALYETFKTGLAIRNKVSDASSRSRAASTQNQLKDFVNDRRNAISDAMARLKEDTVPFVSNVRRAHSRLGENEQTMFELDLQRIGERLQQRARGELSRPALFSRLVRNWMQSAPQAGAHPNRLVIRIAEDWTTESWFLAGPLGDRLGEELMSTSGGALNVAELGLPIEVRYGAGAAHLAPDGTLERLAASTVAAHPAALLRVLKERLVSDGVPAVTGPPGERSIADVVSLHVEKATEAEKDNTER